MTSRRISVRAIVLHEGKLLCARLKPYQNSLNVEKNEWWCIPGGGLDSGESLADCLHREMSEETGVAPEIGNLMYIQQFTHGDNEYLEFFFHVTNADDYLQIDLSQTSHGAAEIAEVTFLDPATVNLYPRFLQTEDLVAQTQLPTKIFNLL